ncbi:hypothetical protein HDU77_009301 [Chytriomyces hyalinus]|nr:hypothetical protein HDU77_009301 [Chytriomyces hyalinus]
MADHELSDAHQQRRGAKRGPKPLREAAPDKRTHQNRESQRRHRQKQTEYVAGLETQLRTALEALQASEQSGLVRKLQDRVAELEQRRNEPQPSHGICTNGGCIKEMERLRTECNTLRALLATSSSSSSALGSAFSNHAMDLPQLLQPSYELSELGANSTSTSTAHSSSTLATWEESPSASNDGIDFLSFFDSSYTGASDHSGGHPLPSHHHDWLDEVTQGISTQKTAAELYGPFDIDETRKQLVLLPSLADSKHVDEMLGLFVTQSHFTDKKTIKNMYKRIIAAKYKMLDSCSLLDKQKVIEIIEQFKNKNRKHLSHLRLNAIHERRNSAVHLTAGINTEVAAQLVPFRDSVTSIPSLKGAKQLVDELCSQFTSHLTCSREEREDKFFALFELSSKLQGLCTTEEDRTKFMLCMEMFRQANRRVMDELLKDK